MRYKFLKTILIVSVVVCASVTTPQKAGALPKSDTDSTQATYLDTASSSQSESNSLSNDAKSNASTDSNLSASLNNNQIVVNNTMTAEDAKQILMNADGNYINKTLNSKKNAALNYDRQIKTMQIKQFYDIVDEPCHVFSLTYDYDDNFIAADSIYYVGINSNRVYVINGTDISSYAYEISSNQKINSYICKGYETCKQWHE